MSIDLEDTIVAVASAPGGALRGIIRMSGPGCIDALARCFHANDASQISEPKSSVVVSGAIAIEKAHRQVPGDLYLWAHGRSYTRQLSAEFHTIGSPPLLQRILQRLIGDGVRAARPGEFTMRAFLAGRMDLTQAEAVLGVIDANDRIQADAALKQLAGGLGRPLHELRDQLMILLADLEAGLDFVEDDISFIESESVARQLTEAQTIVRQMRRDMEHRTVSHDEFRIVLSGEPNVGKSSLLNALVGKQAAIVADQSGTTRDYVECQIEIGGRPSVLVDTAGRFEGFPERALDPIDAEAQKESLRQLNEGHLELICVEAGNVSALAGWQAMKDRKRKILVVTKSDLDAEFTAPNDAICTSSIAGMGIERLKSAITEAMDSELGEQAIVVAATAIRCKEMLASAETGLSKAIDSVISGAGEEITAFEIRQVLHSIGEVVGAIYTDDILDRVFSRFCIGK